MHTLYTEYTSIHRTRMEMSSSIANSFPSLPLSWSKIEFSLVFDVSKNPGYPFLGVILYSVFWAEYYCGFAPMPCHAYADTIPILSPGEDRKHHDWCHAVSPSTYLGTLAKVYPFKHETRAFHTLQSPGLFPEPNSIPQIPTLFFMRRRRGNKKQKDGTRTGRQDVNVHLPSLFQSREIWGSMGWVALN